MTNQTETILNDQERVEKRERVKIDLGRCIRAAHEKRLLTEGEMVQLVKEQCADVRARYEKLIY
jgi:hypothetical protein